MKEFTTEKADDAERPFVEFKFDGVVLTARKPKTAAFVALVDVDDEDGAESARGVMRFVHDALTPDSRDLITKRLEDPDDDLDIATLVPLVNWVVEEFTADRPTGPSNGSSAPPGPTGSSSTGRSRSRASTPST